MEQQSFMQASEDATSSSLIKRAPIALDSSVRMIVEEWMLKSSAKKIN